MPPRRFNRTTWPADGPHRDLLDFLDEVHVRFGCRSLRQIGTAMHLSSTRVYDIVRGVSLPVDEKQTRSLVAALTGEHSSETAAMADDAAALFQKARRTRDERTREVPSEFKDGPPGGADLVGVPDTEEQTRGVVASRARWPTGRSRFATIVGTVGVLVAGIWLLPLDGSSSTGGEQAGAQETAAAPPGSVPYPAPATCRTVAVDGTVQPAITSNGAQYGLIFCPVRINGGKLPITGPYEVSGVIDGALDKRRQILLINHGDPHTCDALGSPPALGGFLAQAAFDSPDGQWSFTDRLGYDEAVTIARHYEFITASSASIVTIEADQQIWNGRHAGAEEDYPGILALPVDTRVLATFDVPAGTYPGAVRCKTS